MRTSSNLLARFLLLIILFTGCLSKNTEGVTLVEKEPITEELITQLDIEEL